MEKPRTVSSTFAIRTRQPHRPKIAKELETLQPEKNYFFKSPLLKILKTLPHNPTQKLNLTMTAKLYTDNGCKTRTTRTPACNSGLAKWRVTCFYETFVGKQTVVLLMNISANNPPLRQAAKRYRKPYFTTVQPQTDDFSTT